MFFHMLVLTKRVTLPPDHSATGHRDLILSLGSCHRFMRCRGWSRSAEASREEEPQGLGWT